MIVLRASNIASRININSSITICCFLNDNTPEKYIVIKDVAASFYQFVDGHRNLEDILNELQLIFTDKTKMDFLRVVKELRKENVIRLAHEKS